MTVQRRGIASAAPSASGHTSSPEHSATANLPSSAYLSPSGNPDFPEAATTGTPADLTRAQRRIIERIIRVDQAGELGANWIYRGQLAVLGRNKSLAELIQHMWDQEKKHIQTFDKVILQHGVRPTALYPFWKLAGWSLGAGTALMGREAAMACTEAVETVIGEHYNDQLTALSKVPHDHPSIPLLAKILAEFRDDELEHLDTAVENDSQKAPAHALLSAIIAGGCRVAIAASERI
ncbi:uncharacterized protein L969DRAFT_87054 [Mixia osmundae IAM 14324]|nr:uncharacterized protein L969DRAFT_87054 [Mixia osmundae IAM 14324]KEI40405.1 hypothetical protein L969DRAFT_87054 [Mixia osmundae IAM 14324]